MRRTHTAILATVLVAMSAIGLTAGPTAQASVPNCTPDAATSALNGLVGGPAPVSTPYTCTNPVHPGALIQVAGSHGGTGGSCTVNFVFTGGSSTYIGTAGHCTLAKSNVSGNVGEFKDAYPTGATVTDKNDRLIGRVVYAIQQDPYDFALIRLNSGITFDKAVPHWGAVSGINTSAGAFPVQLRWVGHGTAIGDVLYARTGVAARMSDPNQVAGVGLIAPGDSGGPVVDDQGHAIGVNVAIGASVGTEPGIQIITRLHPQLTRASAFTGIPFTLA